MLKLLLPDFDLLLQETERYPPVLTNRLSHLVVMIVLRAHDMS